MSEIDTLRRAVLTTDGRVLVEQSDGSYRPVQGETDWAGIDRMSEADLDAAIEKFKDASFRQRIADTAYEYAMDGHTYVHRVRGVLRELGL